MDSLKATDAAAAAVATRPRVTLAAIEQAIEYRYDLTGQQAAIAATGTYTEPLKILSICILVMRNGFTVIGHSAPASPENFDRELGKKFAYENAVRELWPLMGFALRDKLAAA